MLERTLPEWRTTMKLVLLEALIVMIAIRAILSLMGHVPPWPTPMWEFFGGLALVAGASICVQAARERLPQSHLVPPRIPLERIGPYSADAMLVRFGARGEHDIHLN
jgi:hypothetical protein